MMRIAVLSALLALFLVLQASADEPTPLSAAQLDFFETKIRPVLVEHCYECHAADSQLIQGGLRLDHRQGLIDGGDSGPAINLEQPAASLLLDALRWQTLEMPPQGKLPDAIIQDFATWIEMKAPDPRDSAAPTSTREIDIEAGREHWAFRPVAHPDLPEVQNSEWPLQSIDRFILARLEQLSLSPAPDADRYTWLRRVSLDLTGLPPTVAEIEAFINDWSPQAYETVVDRLLNQRAFGERWARHWLDLTGYADQVGTSNDVFAQDAWRYRDYLIDSFHHDKPFDQMVREQIAGDLLEFQTPEEQAAAIIATGFLVLGDIEIVNPDKLKMETDHIDQQVSKVGTVFMGMTLGCVRCHDHKFDPLAREDYYALAGIFRSTQSTQKIPNGIWSGLIRVELPETESQKQLREQLAAAHHASLQQLLDEQTQLLTEQAQVAKQLEQPEGDPTPLTQRRDAINARLGALNTAIEHANFFAPAQPCACAVRESQQIGAMPIAIRGNPYATGDVVPRGVPRVLHWTSSLEIPADQSGRKELAFWLTDPRHPLTSRVAVNRIWQKLFGEGLVRSVDYFGTKGELPSHPELLDHLATRFQQLGWSHKQLIRQLVLSRTYRLSSQGSSLAKTTDPENRWLSHMSRPRLDAETLRDSLLTVSGELVASTGGPALPLEFPENTGSLSPTAVNPPSFALRRFRPEQEFQRTIYLPVVRSSQPAYARLRDLFDFTQPAQIAGRRAQTIVPTQALYLLNDPLPRQRAAALAKQAISSENDLTNKLQRLWLTTLNRPITDDEQIDAEQLLEQIRQLHTDEATRELTAWTELCHALITSNEFLFRL